jgi:hypothetical protein
MTQQGNADERQEMSLDQIVCEELDLARRELAMLKMLPSRVVLAFLAGCLTRDNLKNLQRCIDCKGTDQYFWRRFEELLDLSEDPA